jgi:RimJ/RimL family protein N-acetyltransferase
LAFAAAGESTVAYSTGVFSLLQCDRDGQPVGELESIPAEIAQACRLNADLHRRLGYEPPWVSYIAADDRRAVGGGAFVGAPRYGIVEIAYFTLPEFRQQGYALRTATQLIAIARRTAPDIVLKALTLPEPNPSTKILERLGFKVVGLAHDADAGQVWEWQLP